MKARIYLTLFITLISVSVHAQGLNWQWVRNSVCSQANGYAMAMNSASDAAGNLYVAGYFADSALTFGNQVVSCPDCAGTDTAYIFIVKYDPNGNVLWTKKGSGPGYFSLNGAQFPIGIDTDPFGNVFVCGVFTYDDISFDTDTAHLAGILTSFMVKFDSSGNTLWVRSGGEYLSAINGASVATDAMGNAFMLGDFIGDSILFDSEVIPGFWGTTDIFLVKYDPSGNVIWAKGIGYNGEDFASSVSVDPSGNVSITGLYGSQMLVLGTDTLFNNLLMPDLSFMAKFDTYGNAIWAKQADADTDPNFAGISSHASNVAYTSGRFYSDSLVYGPVSIPSSGSGTGTHFYILKLDSMGNGLWGKGFENGWVLSIKTDLFNNIYLAGAMYDTIVFNSIILPYPGGGFIPPTFIAKLDSSGNALWAIALPDEANVYSLTCGLNQSVYVSGGYSVNMLPIGNAILPLSGISEAFVAKLDTGLAPSCSAHFLVYPDTIPSNWIVLNQVTGDPPITYLWDWGDGTTSAGPTPVHVYSTPGYYNICVSISDASGCTSSYCDSSTFLYRGNSSNAMITMTVTMPGTTNIAEQANHQNSIIISPNPSTGNFTIAFPETIKKTTVQIYNSLGETIFEDAVFNESKKDINLTTFSSGIYFVKVLDGGKSYCRKIIVQQD